MIELPKRYFHYFWGAVAMLLPLYIRIEKVPIDMRFTKDMCFIACVVMSYILFGLKNQVEIKYRIIFAIVSFMAAWNQWTIVSMNVNFQWLLMSFGVLCLYQFLSFVESEDIEYYLNILSVMAVIQIVWIFLNELGMDPYHYFMSKIYGKGLLRIGMAGGEKIDIITTTGSIGNPMVSSAFLGCVALSFLRRNWWVLLIPSAWALYVLGSATGIIAFTVGIISFLLLKLIKNLYKILIGLFIAGLVSLGTYWFYLRDLKFFTDSNRFEVWTNTLTMVKSFNIIWGKGLGYFADRYSPLFPQIANRVSERFLQVHNEYLEIYVAFGVIGLVLLAIILLNVLKPGKSAIIFAMITSYLMTMITAFPLHISVSALVGIVLFSMSVKQEGNEWQQQSQIRKSDKLATEFV